MRSSLLYLQLVALSPAKFALIHLSVLSSSAILICSFVMVHHQNISMLLKNCFLIFFFMTFCDFKIFVIITSAVEDF